MKSLKKKIVLTVVSVLFLGSTATHADTMRISVLGGANASFMTLNPMLPDTVIIPDFGLALGALVTVDFIPILKIDTGLMYKKNAYQAIGVIGGTKFESKISFDQLFIPVIARVELLIFSFGVGAYYAMPFSDNYKTDFTFGGITTSKTSTFDQVGMKGANFGVMFTAGLRIKLPVIPIGIMADVWYLQGLDELGKTPSTLSIKHSDVEALLGISFYL